MTQDEIMQMEAGRELDVFVAIKLMGGFTVHGDNPWSGPPPYSTDIAAAWEVVERMTANEQHTFKIVRCTGWHTIDWGFEVTFGVPFKHGAMDLSAWHITAPLAICRAAALAWLEQQARQKEMHL